MQLSVLAALSELVLPLSFSVKLDGVASAVQLGVVEPAGGLGMVEVKPKSWLMPRGLVRLMILTAPQLLMLTGWGAMKSLTSAGTTTRSGS